MKNAIALVVAVIIVWVLWHVVVGIVGMVVGPLIWLALTLAFCYAVYAVYKMLSKEKQTY